MNESQVVDKGPYFKVSYLPEGALKTDVFYSLQGPGLVGNTNIDALGTDLIANLAYSEGRASLLPLVRELVEAVNHNLMPDGCTLDDADYHESDSFCSCEECKISSGCQEKKDKARFIDLLAKAKKELGE